MTVDYGYIKCWFGGSAETMAAFRSIAENTDRQNLFSHGLSWLDDLDCDNEVESESISYDSMDCTREFLAHLLTELPELQFEGALEHSWPILSGRKTIVEFSAQDGILLWNERREEETLDELFPAEEWEDDDDEEIEIPLTPY